MCTYPSVPVFIHILGRSDIWMASGCVSGHRCRSIDAVLGVIGPTNGDSMASRDIISMLHQSPLGQSVALRAFIMAGDAATMLHGEARTVHSRRRSRVAVSGVGRSSETALYLHRRTCECLILSRRCERNCIGGRCVLGDVLRLELDG